MWQSFALIDIPMIFEAAEKWEPAKYNSLQHYGIFLREKRAKPVLL